MYGLQEKNERPSSYPKLKNSRKRPNRGGRAGGPIGTHGILLIKTNRISQTKQQLKFERKKSVQWFQSLIIATAGRRTAPGRIRFDEHRQYY